MCVKNLPVKKRGRPLLLGEELDTAVKNYIKAVRDAGGVINTSITIATGIVRKTDRSLLLENGGPIRRGKLNSQFIVTRFSILHAGGWSLFRFHISPTATFSMIARDKKLTRLCSPPEEVIKELLGSTVTTDHGIMQRLLPVT